MMNLNLYSHLKLASELSEAVDANHATHLEHRSLDAILELIAIIRHEKAEDNNEINKKANTNINYSGDFYSTTLGYGRKDT
jgi:hypothetical protein